MERSPSLYVIGNTFIFLAVITVLGCARSNSDISIAVYVSPLVNAKEVPANPYSLPLFSVAELPLEMRNITGGDWRDISLKVESIDGEGNQEVLKERFVGLWSSGENVPVTVPRDSEKVMITLTEHGQDHVFAMYQFPEDNSKEPIVPERQ